MLYRFLATVFLIFSATFCFANELEDRAAIKQEVRQLIELGDFDGLDALAEEYRTSQARTSSGLWKLRRLYFAIGSGYRDYLDDEEYVLEMEAMFQFYLDEYPNSPTAVIAKADFHITYASHLRGETWANEVSADMWDGFNEQIRIAQRILKDAEDFAKIDPHWYVARLNTLGVYNRNRDVFDQVLWEGMQRHPAYHTLYFTAANFLDRRWSRDPELLDLFARFAMAHTFEDMGAEMYTRIYWSIHGLYRSELFYKTEADWGLFKVGVADLLEDYPDDWNVQNLAHIACMQFNDDFAMTLMDQMTEEPYGGVWTSRTYDACLNYPTPLQALPNWPGRVRAHLDKREMLENQDRSNIGHLFEHLFGD